MRTLRVVVSSGFTSLVPRRDIVRIQQHDSPLRVTIVLGPKAGSFALTRRHWRLVAPNKAAAAKIVETCRGLIRSLTNGANRR